MKKRLVCGFLISVLAAAAVVTAERVKLPDSIRLDALIDQYEAVQFEHATHVPVAEKCMVCHHQHPGIETESCTGCHKLDSTVFEKSVITTFLSCRTCHGTYDPEDPAMPGLKVAYHKKCFQCHATIGNIGLDPRACTDLCHTTRERQTRLQPVLTSESEVKGGSPYGKRSAH